MNAKETDQWGLAEKYLEKMLRRIVVKLGGKLATERPDGFLDGPDTKTSRALASKFLQQLTTQVGRQAGHAARKKM